MTLHNRYKHQCPSCDQEYIPYDDAIPCPSCGLVEQERYDFIAMACASARFNLEHEGSYVPPAWIVLSFGDAVLSTVFGLLETDRESQGAVPFSQLAREALEAMVWQSKPYLLDYVWGIAVRVHDQLAADSLTEPGE